MNTADNIHPDAALESYLHSFLDPEYRARVGPLGMLRLLDPLRSALRAYEGRCVAAARAAGQSWLAIAEALGEPKASVHRRWRHVG